MSQPSLDSASIRCGKIHHTYDAREDSTVQARANTLCRYDEGGRLHMADERDLPPPTSIDVARRAGVSQSAVSLVFGGKAAGRVGKLTQEAILQAARELGYRPNSAARTLRSGRSHL